MGPPAAVGDDGLNEVQVPEEELLGGEAVGGGGREGGHGEWGILSRNPVMAEVLWLKMSCRIGANRVPIASSHRDMGRELGLI